MVMMEASSIQISVSSGLAATTMARGALARGLDAGPLEGPISE